MKIKNKLDKATNNFNYFLRDFEPYSKKDAKYENSSSYKSLYIPNKYRFKERPYLIFIILSHIKKFNFFPPIEKIAWQISFLYRKIPFHFRHEKFGLHLYGPSQSNVNQIKNELLESLSKAIPFASRIINNYLKDKFNNGEISLSNNYKELRHRYQYCRSSAIIHYDKLINNGSKRMQGLYLGSDAEEIEIATIYAVAMLDAYFSLLEHTFVLLLPFMNRRKIKNLKEFTGLSWSIMFNRLFDSDNKPSATSQLQKLNEIKEQYRNTFAHGNIKKGGGSFFVHFENVGAIPADFLNNTDHLMFNYQRIEYSEFVKIIRILDAFDKFLFSGKSKYGMTYIKTGLPVAYDHNSIKKYHSNMKSPDMFNKMIHKISWKHEIAMNMDW